MSASSKLRISFTIYSNVEFDQYNDFVSSLDIRYKTKKLSPDARLVCFGYDFLSKYSWPEFIGDDASGHVKSALGQVEKLSQYVSTQTEGKHRFDVCMCVAVDAISPIIKLSASQMEALSSAGVFLEFSSDYF